MSIILHSFLFKLTLYILIADYFSTSSTLFLSVSHAISKAVTEACEQLDYSFMNEW